MGRGSVPHAAAAADDHQNGEWSLTPGPTGTVPVRLAAKMNALGLLQISCVSTDPRMPQSWPLEFNLRPHEHGRAAAPGTPASAPVEANATTEARQAARDHITTTFTRPPQSPTG